MKQVAKAVLIDNDNKYLMLYRDNHPAFGDDPDMPGGTMEEGESALETLIREVYEETAITLEETDVELVYEGANYSKNETLDSLYVAKLDGRPDVKLSWEHLSYEWISKEDFLQKSKSAKDTFMHLVYDVLK
jgi:8-oxo-dGTP diphosphatase